MLVADVSNILLCCRRHVIVKEMIWMCYWQFLLLADEIVAVKKKQTNQWLIQRFLLAKLSDVEVNYLTSEVLCGSVLTWCNPVLLELWWIGGLAVIFFGNTDPPLKKYIGIKSDIFVTISCKFSTSRGYFSDTMTRHSASGPRQRTFDIWAFFFTVRAPD